MDKIDKVANNKWLKTYVGLIDEDHDGGDEMISLTISKPTNFMIHFMYRIV